MIDLLSGRDIHINLLPAINLIARVARLRRDL